MEEVLAPRSKPRTPGSTVLASKFYPVWVWLLSRFSHVRLFETVWTVAHQAPLSMGILQASILEWVAVPSSRGSSQFRDQTFISYVSCIGRWVFHPYCHPGKGYAGVVLTLKGNRTSLDLSLSASASATCFLGLPLIGWGQPLSRVEAWAHSYLWF